MWRRPSPKASNIRPARLRWSLIAALALCGAVVAAEKADPLQHLITSEKKAYQDWLDDADEPPAVYLPATRSAVQVFSPGFQTEDAQVLCHDADLPELLEMTGGDPSAHATTVNLQLPRVREKLGDACLARPGDHVVAVGRGWQEERTLDDFVIEHERPACPDDAPYGLWMSFDHPLDEDPLFVTTDPTVPAKDNLFVPVDQYPVAAAGAELRARLKGLVEFPEDFNITVIGVSTAGIEGIVLFERRTITSEDDGLPAMLVAVVTHDAVQSLWTERVDARKGTGRFEFVGTLDMDGDGVLELVFSGTHQTCSYTVVFRRAEGGYEPIPLLVRSCRC